MGYILPGQKFVRYGDHLISDVGAAEARKVPIVKVGRGGSLTKSSDSLIRAKTASADISRTAPTFNDPRYTFTTLSIPTDQRTLNGLYRFFDDTDPIVGNAIRLHCLPAGEQVLTRRGIKNIEDITIEDWVIGRDGRYQRVLNTFASRYVGKLYTIKATGCMSLTCTDEHRILVCGQKIVKVRSDSSRKEPTEQLVWKPAKDLQVGDYVVFPKHVTETPIESIDLSVYVPEISKRNQRVCDVTSTHIHMCMGQQKSYPRYIKVDELFAELAGWYVAEGSVSRDAQSNKPAHVSFALGKHEPDNVTRIQFLLKSIFDLDASVVPNKNSEGVEVLGLSALAAKVFSSLFGSGAHNKRIDRSIMEGPLEVVRAFIKAYIAGDGHEEQYEYNAVTVSKTLAQQLKLVGTRLGLFFGIREMSDQYVTPEYVLRITKRAAAKVLYGEEGPSKNHPHYYYEDDKFFYTPIREITTKEFTGDVYDITTEDNTFLQNFIIHNSEFPLSRISLTDCGDRSIQNHYEDMCNRINLQKLLFDIAIEYWRLGNVFAFGAWNEDDYMWNQLAILNPDYVTVESTYLNQKPYIKLQPDEHLKRVVSSGQPRELYEQLPPQLIKYIRLGQEIPLSSNNVFHLAHNKAPYETLGRSIIKRILKTLIYEDRMSMANFAIATRQVIPITVVKLGDPQSVEEDHLINYLEGNQLKINTFEEFWEKYAGPIVFNDGFKEVKDVSGYGLRTLSQNADGTQSWNIIESVLRHPTPDEVVEVKTPYSAIRMTMGHGLMWINPDTSKYEHVTPIELLQRDKPTIITMDRFDYSVNANTIFDLPLTVDLAHFIGLWTADGSFVGGHNAAGNRTVSTTRLQISNIDAGVEAHLNRRFPKKIRKYAYDSDTTFAITYPELASALTIYYDVPDENGRCAKTGKEDVPQEILFNKDDEIVGAFFAGVLDGDGWLTKGFYGLGVSCGGSSNYHHWLSLGLLAKGIMSNVKFRAASWELTISGKHNILKFLDLVEPFVAHSKKKELCTIYRSHYQSSRESQSKIYCYDLSSATQQTLFEPATWRGKDGRLPQTIAERSMHTNRKLIHAAGIECNTKEMCSNLCGMVVNGIQPKEKNSKFVYDLMLRHDPHCYLVAGAGWMEVSNSGWLPEADEIEDVREMLACHDDQTEVLTENGFKLFKDLTTTEFVGCFNAVTNELEYHLPTVYHEYDYDGELVHFNSSRVDACVTPNHRMWTQQIDVKDESWKFRRADELKANRFRFQSIVGWQGITPPKTLQICGKPVNTKDYLKFLGWFIAEGSCGNWVTNVVRGKEYRQVDARVSQLVGTKANDIQTVLDNLGFKYNIGHGQGKKHPYLMFNIKEEFAQYLYEKFAGGCQNKYIPREILTYNKEHLQILLDSLMAGDGYTTSHRDGSHFEYTTTSYQLANDVCELVLKLGYAPKIVRKVPKNPKHSIWYVVYFSDSPLGYYPMIRKISKKQYTGKVYCVTVPTGIIITKRNGKIQLAGNSREVDPNFCYDEQTECLTDRGWVKYPQLTYDHKIASFNKDTDTLEYHHPQVITIQDYDGDMMHFKTRNIDIKVTPNHRMLVERDDEWQIVHSEDVKPKDRFRASIENYVGETPPKELEIAGKKVDSKAWFEFMGWWLAEGSLSYTSSTIEGPQPYDVMISQSKPEGVAILKNLAARLPWNVRYEGHSFAIGNVVLGKYLQEYCKEGALNKQVPRWMLFADKEHLTLLLNAWLAGDGTVWDQKLGTKGCQGFSVSKQLIDDMYEIALKVGYAASVRTRGDSYRLEGGKRCYTRLDGSKYYDLHILTLSETEKMCRPFIPIRTDKTPIDLGDFELPKNGKQIDWDKVDLEKLLETVNGNVGTLAAKLDLDPVLIWNQLENRGIEVSRDGSRCVFNGNELTTVAIQRAPYKGKIWCVAVPTGIIVTRRGGKTAIQGQTLIYHWGINIEFYGASGRIWNLANEFNRTLKWKLMGLGISEAILSGGSNYASVYAQLEVLRQRYLHFQLMLERFVHQGLFEIVAKLCGFYKTDKLVSGASYTGKKHGNPDEKLGGVLAQGIISDGLDNPDYTQFRTKQAMNKNMGDEIRYVYPRLDWDLMSLSNDIQYKNFLINFDKLFPGERKVSDATFYQVSRLDKDAERDKLKREHTERLDDALLRAKIDKEYLKKFQDNGLTPPPQLMSATQLGPPGGQPAPVGGGVGAPAIPGMPAPAGGGVGAGGVVTTPASPVGQPGFEGRKSPSAPAVPGGPAQAKQESLQIQQGITSASLEERLSKEGIAIEKLNTAEAIELKKSNDAALKQRAKERGDPDAS